MKFLKSFNENAQENVISEIECIRHIVEDEGFHLHFFEGHIDKTGDIVKNGGIKNYIGVSVARPLDAKRTLLSKQLELTLIGDPYVEEFEDRLLDISTSNGYIVRKLKDTIKNGYAVWHIFANKNLISPDREINYE